MLPTASSIRSDQIEIQIRSKGEGEKGGRGEGGGSKSPLNTLPTRRQINPANPIPNSLPRPPAKRPLPLDGVKPHAGGAIAPLCRNQAVGRLALLHPRHCRQQRVVLCAAAEARRRVDRGPQCQGLPCRCNVPGCVLRLWRVGAVSIVFFSQSQ